jgi:hypothetical protein
MSKVEAKRAAGPVLALKESTPSTANAGSGGGGLLWIPQLHNARLRRGRPGRFACKAAQDGKNEGKCCGFTESIIRLAICTFRTGRLTTAKGLIEYSVPQIAGRDVPFRSVIREHLKGHTLGLEGRAIERPLAVGA